MKVFPFRDRCRPKGGDDTIPCSVDEAYREIKRGRIRTFLRGNRRFITDEAIREYIELLQRESDEAWAFHPAEAKRRQLAR